MEFGKWKPEPIHEHDLVEVELPVGAQTLIIDKCQTPGCTYEAGRDLKGGNNDAK